MSNTSIIKRLEIKLEEFIQYKVDKYEFTDYLMSSVDALEGIDYNDIQTAKDFQHKFEIAEFNDEDPEIEGLEKVKINFRKWIKTLKEK